MDAWRSILLACLLACLATGPASGTPGHPPPDGNALQARAREFARVIDSHDPAKFKLFVHTGFAANMQQIPMPAHLSTLMSFWDRSHGLQFHHLETLQPYKGVALYKNTLTRGWSSIYFEVEPDSPHRITTARFLTELPSANTGFDPYWSIRPLAPPPSPHRRASAEQVAHELDALMERLAQADAFSGTVVLAKNGAPVYQRAIGQADRDSNIANRLDTRFNLASMHKMFTAVGIAQLAERGQLSYEDTLARYLPDFPDPESARKIRLKHLLSGTSGLPFGWIPRPQSPGTPPPRTVEEVLNSIPPGQRLLFEPGTHYQYSNMGYYVLGRVIEKVTGMTYEGYVHARILAPAGMTLTDPDWSRQATWSNTRDGGRAVRYVKTFDESGKPVFRNLDPALAPTGGSPGGGGYSTAGDLLKFARALQSGRLVRPQTLKLLQSAKPELGAAGYGYGFDVDEALHVVGHAGGAAGVCGNLDVFPDSGWIAIVLSNYGECDPVFAKMRELVRNATAPGMNQTKAGAPH